MGFDVGNLDPDSDLEGFESGNDESDIQMTDKENESGGEGEAAIAAQKWTTTFSPIHTFEFREGTGPKFQLGGEENRETDIFEEVLEIN